MKTRQKILTVFGIVFGMAILISVIHHYQLRAATEAYIAELKANGEPMELAQVIPPPVPAEKNGADALHHADALFDSSLDASKSLLETNFIYGMSMVAPGKAMVRWQQPDIRDIDGTNSWTNAEAAVIQNAKAFELLRQIIRKPAFDFHIKYDAGVADLDFKSLGLVQTKRSAWRLETAVLCDLHQADTTAAVKNLRTMLALVKAMHDERLVISELVRMAIAQIAVNTSWECLQSPNLTDEQLAELQNDWENLDFIQSGENALAMERVAGEITLAKWRNSDSELQDYFDIGARARESMGYPDQAKSVLTQSGEKAKRFMWRYWWSYPDELRSLKGYEVLMAAMRLAGTNGFYNTISSQATALDQLGISKPGGASELGSLLSGDTDFHSMLSASIIDLTGVSHHVMRMEVAKQVVVTAIALKRYQLKHGNYPLDLDALVPEFISKVPLDPVDGQSLRYRRNADETILLYSIGENGKDDGGDPSLEKGVTSSYYSWQNIHALDWVWPQPATTAEIQKYYEEQAKKSN